MSTTTGGCLCGTVKFSITSAFENFHLCHCTQCQRTTGSAHASNLFTAPDAIMWDQGEDQIQRYDVPDRMISNAFCANCGAHLPYRSLSGKTLVVPAGSLDDPPNMNPNGHIFWQERAGWYDDVPNAPRAKAFPDA